MTAACPFRSMVSRSDKSCYVECAYFSNGCTMEPAKAVRTSICPLTDKNRCGEDCALYGKCALRISHTARKNKEG